MKYLISFGDKVIGPAYITNFLATFVIEENAKFCITRKSEDVFYFPPTFINTLNSILYVT
jgi:hypothetical protein